MAKSLGGMAESSDAWCGGDDGAVGSPFTKEAEEGSGSKAGHLFYRWQPLIEVQSAYRPITTEDILVAKSITCQCVSVLSEMSFAAASDVNLINIS